MDIHTYFSNLGKLSASRLTPEERKERARKAIATRWSKHAPDKKPILTASIEPSGFSSSRCKVCNVPHFKHMKPTDYNKQRPDFHEYQA